MKKAKIALTAIGIFAIVGGAMAFKTYRGGGIVYTPNAQGVCNVTVRNLTTTNNGQTPAQILATTSIAQPCVLLTVYPTAQ